jgi:hypothetical protein
LRPDFRRQRGENHEKKQRCHGTDLDAPAHPSRRTPGVLCSKVPIPVFSHSFLVLVDKYLLIDT